MMNPRLAIRKAQLLDGCPWLFDSGYRTLLYVGAKPGRMEMIDLFVANKFIIDIVEIWPDNVRGLNEMNAQTHAFRSIIHDDIRGIAGFMAHSTDALYDVIMWWHGPEHVEREELKFVVPALERMTTGTLVFASPCGRYRQGPAAGNPYETHLAYLYPDDFSALEYNTSVRGECDKPGSNLIAWRRFDILKQKQN